MNLKNLSLLIFLMGWLPSPVSARQARLKEAKALYEWVETFYRVEKDGTHTAENKIKIKILKSAAISVFGNYRLQYNGKSQTLEVLSAKTVKDGRELIVRPEFIEDEPLASLPGGFDEMRQVLIAFPQIQIGSQIYLHYRLKTKIVPYKGFFSFKQVFGKNSMIQSAKTTVESALPLFFHINNPGRVLKAKIKKGKNKRRPYLFVAQLKKPVFKKIVEERRVFSNPKSFPYIELSTEKKWPRMVRHLAPKYEEVITGPLPKAYKDMALEARKIKTGARDQIDFIISSLIEKIRYLGDWRPTNGGHVPRPLAVTAETGFGDCKDLSSALIAILRSLGFKAWPALIHRSSSRHQSGGTKFPFSGAFNHAIVKAQIQGETFWLDPTNRVSWANGLFTDIMDRPALVLSPSGSFMDKTPKGQSSDSEYQMRQDFTLSPKGLGLMKGSIHFKGRSALAFAGASLFEDKKTTDYRFVEFTGVNSSDLKKWEVGPYDLSSRTARDFSVSLSYATQKDNSLFGRWTQAGPIFIFPYPYDILRFDIRVKDRVSDLFLGAPRRIVFISRLKNIEPKGSLDINCDLKSPWMDLNRTVESLKPLSVKDVYTFKKPQISIKEIRSRQFANTRNNIKRCITRFMMLYKQNN